MPVQPQDSTGPSPTVWNLPNAISAFRFPLAALFVVLDNGGARLALVALAALSDFVDGRLARTTGQVTRAGEVLDPVADKTFMLAALVTLVTDGRLPVWTLPLLLTRDLGVALGALFLTARGVRVRMPARRAGKLVTWLQFGAIGAILLWPSSAPWIAPAVGAAGAYALVDYQSAVAGRGRARDQVGKPS